MEIISERITFYFTIWEVLFANLTASWLLDLPRTHYLSSFRCVNRVVTEKIIRINGPYVYLGLAEKAISIAPQLIPGTISR